MYRMIFMGLLGVVAASTCALGKNLDYDMSDEKVKVEVPDTWDHQDYDDDKQSFIRQLVGAEEPSSKTVIKLGFIRELTNTDLSDETISGFKSKIEDWAKQHSYTVTFKHEDNFLIPGHSAYFIHAILHISPTEDKIEDFYLILSPHRVYTVSEIYSPDSTGGAGSELGLKLTAIPSTFNYVEAAGPPKLLENVSVVDMATSTPLNYKFTSLVLCAVAVIGLLVFALFRYTLSRTGP